MVSKSHDDCFCGSVTVGERGQVVIPAEVRKTLGIEPGDRLLVFRQPTGKALMLAKIDSIQEVLEFFKRTLNEIQSAG